MTHYCSQVILESLVPTVKPGKRLAWHHGREDGSQRRYATLPVGHGLLLVIKERLWPIRTT
jgi:hypothetical protein